LTGLGLCFGVARKPGNDAGDEAFAVSGEAACGAACPAFSVSLPGAPHAVITRPPPRCHYPLHAGNPDTIGGFAVWLLDYPDKPGNDSEGDG